MLDTATKKKIDDCRDILVGKLPDAKAQIEQITIGLIYKFMDDMDKEAIELGGAAKFFSGDYEKYSWDSLFNAKVTATEMLGLYSEAIVSMDKNPNIPALFRNIFKNAYLPYRDPETLKMFLKTIGEFNYTHSEMLGDAFEYLLSIMGSQGDAGQFRTPRHIIDFLVAVVNPKKTDTVLDPACGTAGFLISAFKHIRKNNNNELTPDERKRLINNFTGYDISPDMVRLSLVNLYLHGFSDPHIWEYDTLSSEERWNESFDVVLANPPFMSPKGGIRPHKKFSIASNRSEVLFVDYIAEHLNPKGRAGIIVPEGVIFQSGTAYKDLRKMLVDNYLYAVVSLPAGIFNPYSGVKTSILLMDKELSKTKDEILFVKVDNDGFNLGAQRNAIKGGQLKQAIEIIKQFKTGAFDESTIAHTVSKLVIAEKGDYGLSGERYKNQKNIENSVFPMIKVGELIEFQYGKPLKKEDRKEGNFPVYGSNGVTGFHNEYLVEAPFIVVGRKGSAGALLYSDLSGYPIDTTFYIENKKPEKINLKYAYYILGTLDLDKVNVQAGIPGLNRNDAYKLQIPLPPLSVQEEIVAEMEGYQKIIDGAKMIVSTYKPKIDIDPEWEIVELQSICVVKDGTHDSPKYVQESGIPFVTQKNITREGLSFENVNYITEADHQKFIKRSNVQYGDIIFSMIGANRGMSCIIDDKRVFSIKNVGLIKSKGMINQKYLLAYLKSPDAINYVSRASTGGAQEFISLTSLRTFPIPLPNIDNQYQIVFRIEKEQSLVNANKELIGIFEQKIKDRIGKVWGASNPLPIKIGINSGDLESADKEMLLAAEPEMTYKLPVQSIIPDYKRGFAKQVLGGKIVKMFKDDKNFTHIKFQKLQYLAEQIIEEDLEWNYYRQMAGPYDNKFMHSVFNRLEKNIWFKKRGDQYYPLAKVNDIDKYYQNYFGDKSDKLNNLFALLQRGTEKFCEAVATIYAVWNNHIILKHKFDRVRIKTDFFDWSNRKTVVFTEEEFEKAFTWMQNHEIVPTGFGGLIKEKK